MRYLYLLSLLAIVFLTGCNEGKEMTYNVPRTSELISTTVGYQVALYDYNKLYLSGDVARNDDDIYQATEETTVSPYPDLDTHATYIRGDKVSSSGLPYIINRDLSIVANIPASAIQSFPSPPWSELISDVVDFDPTTITLGDYKFVCTAEESGPEAAYHVLVTDLSDNPIVEGSLYKVASGVVVLNEKSNVDNLFADENKVTHKLVFLDDVLYSFLLTYDHTNGVIIANDLQQLPLTDLGFAHIGLSVKARPFDITQYTSVIVAGSQTWIIKSLQDFDGVALGRLRGDSVTVKFKNEAGTTIKEVLNHVIDGVISPHIDDESVSTIIYTEGVFIDANGTIEITINGNETEVGMIFPSASIDAGMTMQEFKHGVKNHDRNVVSPISGKIDHIKGNRFILHSGNILVNMVDYDKALLLTKKVIQELLAIDGSDTLMNEPADGKGRFASTKLIGRFTVLDMASKVKDGDMEEKVPMIFEFKEIV